MTNTRDIYLRSVNFNLAAGSAMIDVVVCLVSLCIYVTEQSVINEHSVQRQTDVTVSHSGMLLSVLREALLDLSDLFFSPRRLPAF